MGGPVVLLAAAAILTHTADSFYFPPLLEVLDVTLTLWVFELSIVHLLPSLTRMLTGYATASILGVGLGLALGRSRLAREAAGPVVQFLRALPSPAIIPFGILVLGVGDSMKIFVIAAGAVWPILLNTIDGVRGVETTLLDMARSYHIPVRGQLARIIIPSALPRIMAGMRTSLAIAIALMVISEMVASSSGIGYFVLVSQRSFAIPEMWSGIIVLGFMGYALNIAFLSLESRALFWHHGARESAAVARRRERYWFRILRSWFAATVWFRGGSN